MTPAAPVRFGNGASRVVGAAQIDTMNRDLSLQLSSGQHGGAAALSPSATDEAAMHRLFRDGMARLAAQVHIVTSDGPAGRAGVTATAICPVTDKPPTLLVCLNQCARSVRAGERGDPG
jgi:hypothetical protein